MCSYMDQVLIYFITKGYVQNLFSFTWTLNDLSTPLDPLKNNDHGPESSLY